MVNQINDSSGKHLYVSPPMIYTLLVVWEFYWSDNGKLRLYPYVFWPILAAISLLYIRKKYLGRYEQRYSVILLLSFVWVFLSSILSAEPMEGILFLGECLLYFFAIRYIIIKDVPIAFIFRVLNFFAMVHAVFVLMQRFTPGIFYSIVGIISGSATVSILAHDAASGIYYGFTGQSSTVSVYLIIGLVISLYSIGMKIRFKNILSVLLYSLAVLLTNRRGTFVCAVLLVLIFFLLDKSKLWKKIFAILISIGIVAVVGIENIPGIGGLLQKVQVYSQSADFFSGRTALWMQCIEMFKTKPLFGNGIGAFLSSNSFNLPSAHNSYLQKLCELGLMGFFVYFSPYFYCLIKSTCTLMSRYTEIKDKKLFLAFFMMQFFFFIEAMVEGVFETPCLYVIIFLVQLLSLREIDKLNSN